MRRGESGSYEVTSVGGERVRAFVPLPLPPTPALVLDGPLQQLLESAVLALGRLDAVSTLLPDHALFLYAYVRKEAVLSSQIAGTQSSLSDLLIFELEEVPGIPLDDVTEVSNYVAALRHGLRRLGQNFSLSNRLLREIHGVLLSSGRGQTQTPGEFRRSQNWVGGSRPGHAAFVSPPHSSVPDCMSALERFLHATDNGLPVLPRAGLAYVQFQTIHPFLDGNGRVGRLLITLLLCHAGLLSQPLLYLSLYFKQHRGDYYDLLNHVRRTGDWEAWIGFFLEGVKRTAEGAVSSAQRLSQMFQDDRNRIQVSGGRKTGSALRVHDALKARPILSLPVASRDAKLSFRAAASAMELLATHGVAREITGKRRNRMFVYDRYLSVLNEESEVLPGASVYNTRQEP